MSDMSSNNDSTSSETEHMSEDDNESDISDDSDTESSDTSDDTSDDDSDSDVSDSFDENDHDLQPTSAPKLEEIAYVTVAITLWNRATVQIPGMITNHSQWYSKLRSEAFDWSNQLPLPKLLSKCIKERLEDILMFVENWIEYHFRAVFFKQGDSVELYRHVDRFIWNPNGTINYKETARNLLDSNLLSNDLKYRFACTYCLVEDIERLWQLFEDNDPVDEDRFHRYPLIYYWNCHCVNELDRMLPLLGDTPIDEFMIRQRYVDNWAAKEYFFDRLSVEEQVVNTIWLIDKTSVDFQKYLLIKLNESQRLHVYLDRGIEIIMNFVCTDGHEEDAISAWYDVRDLFTREQFTKLCKKLVKSKHIGYVFTKIWTSAYQEYRRHVLTYKNHDFVKRLLDVYEWKQNSAIETSTDLISAVLLEEAVSDIKREIARKPFFFKSCEALMLNDGLEMLNLLISACFPEAEEYARFRLSLVKSAQKKSFADHCQKLVIDGKIEKFARLLNFCLLETYPKSKQIVGDILKNNLKHLDDRCLEYYSTGDVKELNEFLAPLIASFPDIILDYKTQLVLSENGMRMCVSHFSSSTDTLAAIVADSFPPNSKTAAEFKRNIIFNDECIDKLQNLILERRLNNAKKFVGWFLKSIRDKKKLKVRLIDHLTQQRRRIDSQTRKTYSEFL